MINVEQINPIKKLNKSDWYALIREWEASEISQPAFCRQKQISYNTFTYWRGKLLKESHVNSKPCFSKVAVSTPANHHQAQASVMIELASDKKIIIPLGASDQQLKRLFHLLGILPC